MTNAEAQCNKTLHPRKPEGSLGRTAQDVHLDSHAAPELWFDAHEGSLDLYYCTIHYCHIKDKCFGCETVHFGQSHNLSLDFAKKCLTFCFIYIYKLQMHSGQYVVSKKVGHSVLLGLIRSCATYIKVSWQTLMSHQLHRVTSGWTTHSKLFYSKHNSSNHNTVNSKHNQVQTVNNINNHIYLNIYISLNKVN